MPIYKRCSRCNKRIPSGTICSCADRRYKEEDKYKGDDKYSQFYQSSEWEDARAKAKQKSNGLDVFILFMENRIVFGEMAHHIIPLRENWGQRTSQGNLIYVSERTHRQIHKALKQGGEVRQKMINLCRDAVQWYASLS